MDTTLTVRLEPTPDLARLGERPPLGHPRPATGRTAPRVRPEPATPVRRRPHRTSSRRPTVAPIPVDYAFGTTDDRCGHDTELVASPRRVRPAEETPYRMSRAARLSITLTVLAAGVVLGFTALFGDSGETVTVTVLPGDSLFAIAGRVDSAADTWDIVDRIVELNGLDSQVLRPGQVLEVPAG